MGVSEKTVDFRLLNSFSDALVSCQTNLPEVLASIPKKWNTFSILDLEQGVFQVAICVALQPLFGFETYFGNWTYIRLPQGWNCNPRMFHSRVKGVLEGKPALNYLDDLVVGGRNKKEHDIHLRQILERLSEVGFTVNKKKARIGLKKTNYLGYTLEKATYLLDDYIATQSQNIPPIESRRDLLKVIGVLNVCKGVCPGFNVWVQEVYNLPKTASLEEMRKTVQRVWEKILIHNQPLCRGSPQNCEEYHILTNWC